MHTDESAQVILVCNFSPTCIFFFLIDNLVNETAWPLRRYQDLGDTYFVLQYTTAFLDPEFFVIPVHSRLELSFLGA